MDEATCRKLERICLDYQTVVGRGVGHFYCPILFRDEPVDLCRAHIVNRAFRDSDRGWTVQRKDVDNFYGRSFEGDFVDIVDLWSHTPEQIIGDRELTKRFRPKVLINGETVPHFFAQGPVPGDFTEAVVGCSTGVTRLGLKIHPRELSAANKRFQILIEKDIRWQALVSLLKAAHLTLFEMLGYRYALSPGGFFLGKTVLGDFFLNNEHLGKSEITERAFSHFAEFANMARPVVSHEPRVEGTASDGFVLICRCEDQTPWALILFIRTATLLHAVLVPVLDQPCAAARFISFLRGEGGVIQANWCRFEDDKWHASDDLETLVWPKANLS